MTLHEKTFSLALLNL